MKIKKPHLGKIFKKSLEIFLGTLTGAGNGFATKEFTITSAVQGANWNVTDNVEVSISEPTTSTP